MTLSPSELAKSGTEHAHQRALVSWAMNAETRHKWPELQLLHAVPSGGARDEVTAGKLKAEGVISGVWDLFLPVARRRGEIAVADLGKRWHGSHWHGLYIEMKKPGRFNEKFKKGTQCFRVGGVVMELGGVRSGGLSATQYAFGLDVHDEGFNTAICYSWQDAQKVLIEYLCLDATGER